MPRLPERNDSQTRPSSALESEPSHTQLIGEGGDRLSGLFIGPESQRPVVSPLPVAEWLRPKNNAYRHWLSPAVSPHASGGAAQAGAACGAVSNPTAGRRWRSQ